MGKPQRPPPWASEPMPPTVQAMAVERLRHRVEILQAEKMNVIFVLLALVKSLGGEASFSSATLRELSPQDKLHYRIEDEQTFLTYEAETSADAIETPPPPKSRIILPGSKDF